MDFDSVTIIYFLKQVFQGFSFWRRFQIQSILSQISFKILTDTILNIENSHVSSSNGYQGTCLPFRFILNLPLDHSFLPVRGTDSITLHRLS